MSRGNALLFRHSRKPQARNGAHIKTIHVIAGSIALLSGAVALYAAKGSWLHRRSGIISVGAMMVV